MTSKLSWAHQPERQNCCNQAGTSSNTQALLSLVFLRTLVFEPFLQAPCYPCGWSTCSTHTLSPQIQHYLWPATYLFLTCIKKSCWCLENSCHKMLLFPIPMPRNGFCHLVFQLLRVIPGGLTPCGPVPLISIQNTASQTFLLCHLDYLTFCSRRSQHGTRQRLQTTLKPSLGCKTFPALD